MQLSPQSAQAGTVQGTQAWLVVAVDFPRAVRAQPRRGDHRQRQADRGALRRRMVFPVFKRYPETAFGGEFPLQANYKSPYIRELIAEKDGWMIWPVIPSIIRASITSCRCRRRPRLRWKTGWAPTTGPRRAGTGHLRLSHLGAVRHHADPDQLRDRCDRRALQGFYGGWVDWSGSACWRSGRACRCSTC